MTFMDSLCLSSRPPPTSPRKHGEAKYMTFMDSLHGPATGCLRGRGRRATVGVWGRMTLPTR